MKRIIGAITVLTVVTVAQERPAAKPAIQIVTVSGQGGTNLLDGTTPAPPLVEIQDASGKRLAGAQVTFQSPEVGPRAIFSGGKHTMSVRSNKEGRATPGKMAVADAGSFEITVEAVFRGQRAAISLKQTNYPTLSDAQSASVRPTGTNLIAGRNSLRIEILEGDDAVNIIDKATAVKPIIRVVDKNNLPVAGVAVTMAIVATRGGGEFSGAKQSIVLKTDGDGKVQAEGLRPKGKGSFRVDIKASVQGDSIQSSVSQTNFANERAALDAGRIPYTSHGSTESAKSIQIRIVEGEGGVNVVKGQIVVKQVVEVTDQAGNAIPGARIAFVLPAKKAGAAFADKKSYTLATTDSSGRAEAGQMRPTGKGPLTIRVLAVSGKGTANTAIQQTNFLTVAAAKQAGKTPGSSSSAQASSGAGGTSSGATTAATAGLSAGTKALAVIGLAGLTAGTVAKAAGVLDNKNTSSSTSTNSACSDAALNQYSTRFTADFNAVSSSCGGFFQGVCNNPSGACRTSCQNLLNDFTLICQCGAQVAQLIAQLNLPALARQAGLTFPSSCQ